jgi:hypothetical protein
MIRIVVGRCAALATALFFLAGCGGSAMTGNTGAPATSEENQEQLGATAVFRGAPMSVPSMFKLDLFWGQHYKHPCFGEKGVIASPCPVKLNDKNDGGPIAVTVSGPGVVNARVVQSGCYGKNTPCNVGGGGTSNPTQFIISATADYTVCGKASVTFAGLNSRGKVVGKTHITVVDRFYCTE